MAQPLDSNASAAEGQKGAAHRFFESIEPGLRRELDDIARLAANVCGVSFAIAVRNVASSAPVMASAGVSPEEGDRLALALHELTCSIAAKQETFTLPDVSAEPTLATAYSGGAGGLRCFAGTPLVLQDGQAVGALCVLDPSVRTVSPEQLASLQILGRQIVALLERQRYRQEQQAAQHDLRTLRRRLNVALLAGEVGTFSWDVSSDQVSGDSNFARLFGVDLDENGALSIANFLRVISAADRPGVEEKIQRALEERSPYEAEYRILTSEGERWVVARGRVRTDSSTGNDVFAGVLVDISDRKKAEAAVREREELFRTVFEQAPDDAVIVMDRQRTLTAWNPAAERITGWAAADAVGQSADLIFSPEDRSSGWPARETATADRLGKSADERWHLRKDGSTFWGVGTMNALHDSAGRVRGYLKVFRDATAQRIEADTLAFLRRLTEALIEQSDPDRIIEIAERMLGMHLRASRVLVAEATPDEEHVFVRQVWAEPGMPDVRGVHRLHDYGEVLLTDYRANRAHIRRNAAREYPPGSGLNAIIGVKALAAIDIPVLIDGRLRALFVVHQATPREWTDGEIALTRQVADRMVAEVERTRAIRELRDSEARFRELADAMPQIVFAARADGTVDYYNRRWYEYTGFDPTLIGRQSWEGVHYPEDLERLSSDWDRCIREGRQYEAEQRYLRASDRTYRWHLVRAVPMKDASGKILRWFGCSTDIDDFKQLQAEREKLLVAEHAARTEAEQQSQIKDEFLATLSHELRTPLNAIVGWTQILRQPGIAAGQGDLDEGLAVIERNAKAQTQIIEDILDMSRITSGKLRLAVQRVDLAAIVRAGADTVRPAADAKGVRLQLVVDPHAGPIRGDPDRLHQVFWNLLTNAIKFTSRGGRVHVVLSRIDSHIEVSVTDTGEGISADFLPHVFDRFRQADASTTRRHGGLGLGLAIVKQLVELHGGSVRVSSAGPNQGSSFVVELPITVTQTEPQVRVESERPANAGPLGQAPASRQDDRSQLRGVSVFVVDDEPDGRATIRRLLEAYGATVKVAASAQEAIGLFDEFGPPTVMISDIGMPGEDGYSLLAAVRARKAESGGRTPSIALTAYAHSADRVRALQAGYNRHLSKPVETTELVLTVASLARGL